MDTLKKKIGPLPMYVWVGIVVIAGVGFMLWKRSQASATANPSAASTTGSSTNTAPTSGYTVSDTGGQGWQGYNNNANAPATATPGSEYIGPLSYQQALATFNAGTQLFDLNPTTGMQPWSGTSASQLTAANAAGWNTTGNYPFYVTSAAPATTAAAPITATPAVAAAATAPVTSLSTPVTNSTNPASAIAPSALSGPTVPATAAATGPTNPTTPLTAQQVLAAIMAGTPLWDTAPGGTPQPWAGTVKNVQHALAAPGGWSVAGGKNNYPVYA